MNHNNPAAIVVINVADAELCLQSSQEIFTDNSARHFKKRLYTDATKTCDTMRGWRFLLHSNPSSKPVGSILAPLTKNTPCFTWALAPTGEHSFAFFRPKLPFSKIEQIGKTGGEYQWIGVTAYPIYEFNEQSQQWFQAANSYSVNEAVAVMRSYLVRWLLPRCTSLPDERGDAALRHCSSTNTRLSLIA